MKSLGYALDTRHMNADRLTNPEVVTASGLAARPVKWWNGETARKTIYPFFLHTPTQESWQNWLTTLHCGKVMSHTEKNATVQSLH